MQHLYTDDELVALAASATVRWTGPLPTLAIEESDELVRAAIRGARALAVRRATDPGAGGEQIRSLVRQSEAARTAVMFLIDADGASVPPCDVSTFFLLGSDEVLEDRVSAAGVHGFRVLNRPRLHQLLGDVVSEVIASGVSSAATETDGRPRAAGLAISTEIAGVGRTVVATSGSVDVIVDGRRQPSPSDGWTVDAALREISL